MKEKHAILTTMKALYIFWGKVKGGAKRGKDLGFPTANIALHKRIAEGIYVSVVKIRPSTSLRMKKKTFSAATFIGSAKTFGEKEYKAESFLLDFDKNIYGKWITVTLLHKIRENKKFTNEKELREQMKKDVEEVRKYFKEDPFHKFF